MERHSTEAWQRAADELKVELSGPIELHLSSGDVVQADLLFHHFGAPKGTLVVPLESDLRRHRSALNDDGYTISQFNPPRTEKVYSAARLMEILKDWTWCGDLAKTPEWLGD
jgi:hypothetical protein